MADGEGTEAGDPGPDEPAGVALLERAKQLVQLKRMAEAEAVCDRLLAQAAGPDGLRAKALLVKAVAVDAQGRGAEALAVLEELLASPAGGEDDLGARALELKARVLGRDDPARAAAVRDELVARFAGSADVGTRERVALALLASAQRRSKEARFGEAVSVLERLAGEFGDVRPARRPHLAADVAFLTGVYLGEAGRRDEAAAAFDALLARFDGDPAPAIQGRVAHALSFKAGYLAESGRRDEALALLRALVERFGGSADDRQRLAVTRARLLRGAVLVALEDPEGAAEAWSELLDAGAEPDSAHVWAEQLLSGARTLMRSGAPAPALRLFEGIVARLRDAGDPALRTVAAHAQLGASIALRDLGRHDEAVAAYDAVFDFGAEALPVWDAAEQRARADPEALRAQLAQALLARAVTLSTAGRRAEALVAYEVIVADFAADEVAIIATIVAAARQGRDELAAGDGP